MGEIIRSQPQQKNNFQTGYTLVEISVVLVILGLMTGGIMIGTSMIRNAEIQTIYKDLDKYKTAIYAFRTRYEALPGDMKNAVRYWGAAAGGVQDGTDSACLALDHDDPATGTETCNGNGDGRIQDNQEMVRAWQHLANAGLIDGHYTGVSISDNTNRHHKPGVNCPASKYSDAAGFSMYFIEVNADPLRYPGEYNHTLFFGEPSGFYETVDPALPPEIAYSIDMKLDDGLPGSGNVRPRRNGWYTNCSLNDDDPDAARYNLPYEDKACNLQFITGL